jgi:quinol monooxygenase YgiN
MFAILVRFEPKDQPAAHGFDALVEKTVRAIQESEPETLVYAVHRVEDAPLSRIFYELYASREAHGEHESAEDINGFHAEVNQYLESVRMELLDAPSGKVF